MSDFINLRPRYCPLWINQERTESEFSYKNEIYITKYNHTYLDDLPFEIDPVLGIHKTNNLISYPFGGLSPFQRGFLIREDFLDLLTSLHLAPHMIIKVPFVKEYDNSKWNESGCYYLILFYESGFNQINWDLSTFFTYDKKYVNIDKHIIDRNVKFKSKEDFLNQINDYCIGINYENIYLNDHYSQFDVFGMFYFNYNICFSLKAYELLKQKKVCSSKTIFIDKIYNIYKISNLAAQ